jgi:nucleoside-specific channel-forming protein
MKKTLLGLALLTTGLSVYAEDYSEDIRKNDNKFFNINLMHGENQKNPFGNQDNTYLELEFGGRSGVLDLYGYVDIMNITGNTKDDTYNGDNFFMELKPRLSIDGMTGKDLSIGPIKEWYVAGYLKAGDNSVGEPTMKGPDPVNGVGTGGLFHTGIGIGTDLELPWFGKTGLNLLAIHKSSDVNSSADGEWDGYSLQWNFFKPVHSFENGSFVAYQGYMTYDFGMNKVHEDDGRSDYSFQWFNGIYYHYESIAVGYGLKVYKNMANFKDGGYAGDTSGIGHYFDVTYKF